MALTRPTTLAEVRKFMVGLATAAGEAITLGVFAGDVSRWVAIGLSVAGAYGIYRVPNADAPLPPAAPAAPVDPTLGAGPGA